MSIDTVIQLSTEGQASSANSIQAIDIPEDGSIEAVVGHVRDATILAGEMIVAELSFLSTRQTTVNDARGVILSLSLAAGALQTNGLANGHSNIGIAFPNGGITVQAGERIHMHAEITGTLSANIIFILYLSTIGGGRRTRKRR